MLGIEDDTVFTDFEEKGLQRPVPRKEIDTGRTIYMSQDLKIPKHMGAPVLCDFGSAMLGDQHHSEFIQPNIYRAPEVILEASWTYNVDIWNVGCMVRQTAMRTEITKRWHRFGTFTKVVRYSPARTPNLRGTEVEPTSPR